MADDYITFSFILSLSNDEVRIPVWRSYADSLTFDDMCYKRIDALFKGIPPSHIRLIIDGKELDKSTHS